MKKTKCMILYAVCLISCFTLWGCEQPMTSQKADSLDNSNIHSQSSIFKSLSTDCKDSIKAEADVYLMYTDATLLYIELAEDITLDLSISYTKTSGSASLYLNSAQIYDFKSEKSDNDITDSISITLKKGENTFSLKGNDCTIKLSIKSESIDKRKIIYSGMISSNETMPALSETISSVESIR